MMIYENAKRISRIINRVYSIILIAIIVCGVNTFTYGCPVIVVACILDIGLWAITCKKNKASEEYPKLKTELIKSIISLVICAAIIVGFTVLL